MLDLKPLFIFLKKNAEGFVLKWKKSCNFFSRIFLVVFLPKKYKEKQEKTGAHKLGLHFFLNINEVINLRIATGIL